jgi:hypothetical protein
MVDPRNETHTEEARITRQEILSSPALSSGYCARPLARPSESNDVITRQGNAASRRGSHPTTLGGRPRRELGVLFAFGGSLSCANAIACDPAADSSGSTVEVESVPIEVSDSSSGWTALEPSSDTIKLYVSSSSGNDSNDGRSTARPKRTIAAARELLRHGKPDWLLLRRGDAWEESLGQWKKSGRSAAEPMVVTSYGDDPARPLLRTGAKSGVWTNGGGGTPPRIENVAFVGLHFVAHEYRGTGDCVGAQWLQPSTNVLFEDCQFQAFSTNLVLQAVNGRHKNLRLRRSVIVDAYSIHGSGNHPQGLYAYAVDGLTIEDNVFDHNGWNESVPDAGADVYSHNLYIDNGSTDVVVRGNIIANASSHGMQLRCGGLAENNLFLHNSIALSVGCGNHPEPAGVIADVRGNVILDGKDIDAANPRGWGMWFGNIQSGRVAHNVIAHNSGKQPLALVLDGDHVGDETHGIGVRGLVIERNVVLDWGGSFRVEGNGEQIRDIKLTRNDIQDSATDAALVEYVDPSSVASVLSSGNRYYSRRAPRDAWTRVGGARRALPESDRPVQAEYPHAERCAKFFADALGANGTARAFLAEARAQSRASWRPSFTADSVNRYVKEGLDLPTK